MTKAESVVLLVVVILVSVATAAQNVPSYTARGVPDGWVEAPSSKANPTLWECAGRGGSWVVNLQQGALRINELNFEEASEEVPLPQHLSLSKEMKGRHSLLRTADGWLIGFDAGEFGGGLWWFNSDGSVTRKLLSENVHSILETPKAFLF